jgi:DNA-binding transcriptional MocR family regulator
MAFFSRGRDGQQFLRLNFVMQPPDAIEESIKRLAKSIRRPESPTKR